MLVRRRARLIYRVTEEFKARLARDMGVRLGKADAAVAAVAAVFGNLSESDQPEQYARLKGRRDRLLRARDEVAARLAQVQGLKIGDELAEGSVEFLSEVSLGDPQERLADAQVVICDGRIEEFRDL